MNDMYKTGRQGLTGNDDCGQLSAWYVFSAIGFYPVCPGSNEYVLGSPVFDKVTITNSDGSKFVLQAQNQSDSNVYIQAITLRGENYSKNFITHSDITSAENIVIEMGDKPNINRGINKVDFPYSFSEKDITSPPFLTKDITFFDDSACVELACRNEDVSIFYTLDESEPGKNSFEYESLLIFIKPQ